MKKWCRISAINNVMRMYHLPFNPVQSTRPFQLESFPEPPHLKHSLSSRSRFDFAFLVPPSAPIGARDDDLSEDAPTPEADRMDASPSSSAVVALDVPVRGFFNSAYRWDGCVLVLLGTAITFTPRF